LEGGLLLWAVDSGTLPDGEPSDTGLAGWASRISPVSFPMSDISGVCEILAVMSILSCRKVQYLEANQDLNFFLQYIFHDLDELLWTTFV
jgi:hypothetical protein